MTVDDLLRTAAHDLLADVRSTTDPERALDQLVEAPMPRRVPPPVRSALVAAAVLVVLAVAAVVVVQIRDDTEDVATSPPPTTEAPRPTTPGPATGESAGLAMTVDPATGLVDGDEVQVTADGLPTDLEAGFLLCRADALLAEVGMEQCQFGPERELRPDAAGHLDGSITVERLLTIGEEARTVDCAREARCAVGVVVITREPGEEAGTETIRFDLEGLVAIELAPQGELPVPTVRVEPAEGLRHGQPVTISGEGFVGPIGSAALCTEGASPGGARCTFVGLTGERQRYENPPVDERGRFEVEAPIWRAIPTYDADDRPQILDCAVEACTLQVTSGDGRVGRPVPLHFDPAFPLPAVPTVQVDPATGVRSGDPITITLRGLAAGQSVLLGACSAQPSEPELGACSQSTLIQEVVADADGEVTIDLPAIDPAQYGVDCTQPDSCGVTIMEPIAGSGDPLLSLVEPALVQYAP
ncbi:MAG TPA: neocarzinostatin apoprotein domain-containing protein [Iamia sp.]|nr:neocarzinostatin apoprotein domain-containing protein [Iamia sp.]